MNILSSKAWDSAWLVLCTLCDVFLLVLCYEMSAQHADRKLSQLIGAAQYLLCLKCCGQRLCMCFDLAFGVLGVHVLTI